MKKNIVLLLCSFLLILCGCTPPATATLLPSPTGYSTATIENTVIPTALPPTLTPTLPPTPTATPQKFPEDWLSDVSEIMGSHELIFYSLVDKKAHWSLHFINLDGKYTQQLSENGIGYGKYVFWIVGINSNGTTLSFEESESNHFILYNLLTKEVSDFTYCPGKNINIVLSPDDRYFAAYCRQDALDIVQVSDLSIVATIRIPSQFREVGHMSPITWSPDGRWLAYWIKEIGVSTDYGPYVTDMNCLSEPDTCNDKTQIIYDCRHSDGLCYIDFSGENPSRLLAYRGDDIVRIFDPTTGNLTDSIRFPKDFAEDYILSPDLTRVAFIKDDNFYLASLDNVDNPELIAPAQTNGEYKFYFYAWWFPPK